MARVKAYWFLTALETYRIMDYTWRIWKFASVVRDVLEIRRICKDINAKEITEIKKILKNNRIVERA